MKTIERRTSGIFVCRYTYPGTRAGWVFSAIYNGENMVLFVDSSFKEMTCVATKSKSDEEFLKNHLTYLVTTPLDASERQAFFKLFQPLAQKNDIKINQFL